MSLTMGSGPFGHRPAGRFNVAIPVREVLFVDPLPRRIRALRGGNAVVDSRRVKMLHQHGVLPRYFFPRDDVRCFFNEVLDVDVDGEREQRPETPWGRPGWWRGHREVR